MIDLTDICGIPLSLDEETGVLKYDDCVACQSEEDIGITDIIPVLLNKFLKYPEQVYKHYVGIQNGGEDFKSSGISYDIIHLPHGLLGIEYSKTHVFSSFEKNNKYSCMVEVTKGEVTVLIQKNEQVDDPYANTIVEDVKMIQLFQGEKLAIPTGVLYTFVNTGSEPAIFVVISADLDHIDYSNLVKEKGLAYFIISKNARLEIVANPKYRIVEPALRVPWSTMESKEKQPYMHNLLEGKVPLYKKLNQYLNDFVGILV
ncbi:hypothetical protein KC669_00275 [Candidatus Dojkabacteria bacterium]|uniref:glucose-6-phosphate isomerase n=1 Tax=Candidatus Dojkabacteria bacterium TaxID=2099670 RepID=A0A955L9A8_9BACT|nr:hypothetical protein [Candidatus Dojkabacteria bacterium]